MHSLIYLTPKYSGIVKLATKKIRHYWVFMASTEYKLQAVLNIVCNIVLHCIRLMKNVKEKMKVRPEFFA